MKVLKFNTLFNVLIVNVSKDRLTGYVCLKTPVKTTGADAGIIPPVHTELFLKTSQSKR